MRREVVAYRVSRDLHPSSMPERDGNRDRRLFVRQVGKRGPGVDRWQRVSVAIAIAAAKTLTAGSAGKCPRQRTIVNKSRRNWTTAYNLSTLSTPMLIHTPGDAFNTLYRQYLERGIRYCFPGASLQRSAGAATQVAQLSVTPRPDGAVDLTWLGATWRMDRAGRALTANETKLLWSIARVLSLRYKTLIDSAAAVERIDMFRGVPEDRFVSAYLDAAPYAQDSPLVLDRIAEAIEVLRISSSSTYENRRINTGVLLFGREPDPCHAAPSLPERALAYAPDLTTTRTFYRLCDGMRTLALVDESGRMVELLDIAEWATPYADLALPVPCALRFLAHCRATLRGGHVCLVLTPNGEIKAFADGMQVFNFLDGRWRLSDSAEKYAAWERALTGSALAERLFTTALNLAERRRGGLFVVLDDRQAADRLVSADDRIDRRRSASALSTPTRSKDLFHYLLRAKSVLDLTPTVLESIARIDGAIVLDRAANLLAFGAILRHQIEPGIDDNAVEGGRTTAALAASRYGHVLKVSEDGLVSYYSGGRCVWEV
jgi:hypothetical protein